MTCRVAETRPTVRMAAPKLLQVLLHDPDNVVFRPVIGGKRRREKVDMACMEVQLADVLQPDLKILRYVKLRNEIFPGCA